MFTSLTLSFSILNMLEVVAIIVLGTLPSRLAVRLRGRMGKTMAIICLFSGARTDSAPEAEGRMDCRGL